MKPLNNYLLKILLFFFLILKIVGVSAHTFSITSINTSLSIEGDKISSKSVILLPYSLDDLRTEEEKYKIKENIANHFENKFIIANENTFCSLERVDVYPDEYDRENTIIIGDFICDKQVTDINNIVIQSELFQILSFGVWQHFISIDILDEKANIILDLEQNIYPYTLSSIDGITSSLLELEDKQELEKDNSSKGSLIENESDTSKQKSIENEENIKKHQTIQKESTIAKVIKSYIIIGIEHILIGTDHILFVVSLVLLVISIKDILKLTITFTISHSITLILASLGLISLTGKIVEPIIALSIVYMAIDNFLILRGKKENKFSINKRLIITFLFGLFHGLGFAGVLSEISIPENYFLTSLLSFNLGVEIGQLLIVFIILLPILYLVKRFTWKNIAMQIISIIIALVSIYWFIERVFL